jgi:hypothetical protein
MWKTAFLRYIYVYLLTPDGNGHGGGTYNDTSSPSAESRSSFCPRISKWRRQVQGQLGLSGMVITCIKARVFILIDHGVKQRERMRLGCLC